MLKILAMLGIVTFLDILDDKHRSIYSTRKIKQPEFPKKIARKENL